MGKQSVVEHLFLFDARMENCVENSIVIKCIKSGSDTIRTDVSSLELFSSSGICSLSAVRQYVQKDLDL